MNKRELILLALRTKLDRLKLEVEILEALAERTQQTAHLDNHREVIAIIEARLLAIEARSAATVH